MEPGKRAGWHKGRILIRLCSTGVQAFALVALEAEPVVNGDKMAI
jgi:hypothetical protein